MKVVFWLDRDGTIVDDPGYLSNPEDLVLLPGTARAIARLNAVGPVVLVTNQSGIGRGYASREQVDRIHEALALELARAGARLDRIEICPHAPSDGCSCRKPAPGMIERARAEMDPAEREFVVGDKPADLELARATGCVAVLVRTGEGRKTEAELDAAGELGQRADHVADDLGGAVEWILGPGMQA
jgi:histidinol-phosphate phosphatase family protein